MSEQPKASFDPKELKAWAAREGRKVIKQILKESAEKEKRLRISQIVEPERKMKQMTR